MTTILVRDRKKRINLMTVNCSIPNNSSEKMGSKLREK